MKGVCTMTEDLKTKVQHRPKGAGGNQEFQFVRPTLFTFLFILSSICRQVLRVRGSLRIRPIL